MGERKTVLVVHCMEEYALREEHSRRKARLAAVAKLLKCAEADLTVRYFGPYWAFRDVLTEAMVHGAAVIDLIGHPQDYAECLAYPRSPHEGFKGKIIEGKKNEESGEWTYDEVTVERVYTVHRTKI